MNGDNEVFSAEPLYRGRDDAPLNQFGASRSRSKSMRDIAREIRMDGMLPSEDIRRFNAHGYEPTRSELDYWDEAEDMDLLESGLIGPMGHGPDE